MATLRGNLRSISRVRRDARLLRLDVSYALFLAQTRQMTGAAAHQIQIAHRYRMAHDEFDAALNALELFVFGGHEPAAGSVMECVALSDTQAFIGSGVLVSSEWVLTAAHCAGAKFVFQGASLLDPTNGQTETIDRKELVGNDLVLLHVQNGFSSGFASFPDSPIVVDETAEIAGFGFFDDDGGSGVKRIGDVKITNINATALFVYSDAVEMCQGDSGGPLFVIRGGSRVTAGIAQAAPGNSNCGPVGQYTPVSGFVDQMEKIIGSKVTRSVSPLAVARRSATAKEGI